MSEFSSEQEQEKVPDEIASMFDLKQKKKKKKKKEDKKETSTPATPTTTEAEEQILNSAGVEVDTPPYTYIQLLERAVGLLHQHNPEYSEKRRHTMKPPQLVRQGTKKTLWTNFSEICKMMQRSPDHVFQFMMAELGTEGSIDGAQRLVIRGKFVPKYIESLLRKYIVEYVTCQMCRSFNTTLTRDNVSRLFFNQCQECGSSRSVAPIRAGYHAQTRADRRAIKNAKI
jgi:translation initiation factor 2 subunit 2